MKNLCHLVYADCSIDSKEAANKIVTAAEHGEAQLVITIQAQIVKAIHAIAPAVVAAVFDFTNQFLPGSDGIGSARAKGKESESVERLPR